MEKTNQKHVKKVSLKLFYCLFLTGLCLFLFTSCTESNEDNASESIKELKADIEDLKEKIEWIEKDLDKSFQEHLELADKVDFFEIKEACKSSAFFCISKGIGDGFQVVKSSSGSFFLSIKEVKPYLSGYKIIFCIGNPLLATFDNAKLTVKWNRSHEAWKNDKEYAEKWKKYLENLSDSGEKIDFPKIPKRTLWSEEEKKKEFTLESPIKPGYWNTIEVHITPATLEQLDNIWANIETTVVKLTNEQKANS